MKINVFHVAIIILAAVGFTMAGGCFSISDSDELYQFASIVNENPTACAKLTADIVVNENVLGKNNANVNDDGEYTGDPSSFRKWTPIGTENIPFQGSFDGQGHTISGLYFNDANGKFVGLFGYVSDSGVTVTIQNVGIVDSYFNGNVVIGGILGLICSGASANIANVFNASSVNGKSIVGGIVGMVGLSMQPAEVQISNAYNTGNIKARDNSAGGFIGDQNSNTISIYNGYNVGEVSGRYSGNIIGNPDNAEISCENVYYLGSESETYGNAVKKEFFEYGSVATSLHRYNQNGVDGSIWGQNVTAGDKLPNFSRIIEGAAEPYKLTLHFSSENMKDSGYVQGIEQKLPRKTDNGDYILGWYENSQLSGIRMTAIPSDKEGDLELYAAKFNMTDGCVAISDSASLFAFSELVNDGENSVCAVLTNNVIVNKNVLVNGEINDADSSSFTRWNPIGSSTKPFMGLFDGKGYTISGLYVNDTLADYVGLFGKVSSSKESEVTIKNVGIVDSYFNGDEAVGGVVGLFETDAAARIENAFNAGIVKGVVYAGGIVGYINKKTPLQLSNVYNVGKIEAEECVGGLVGNTIYGQGLEVFNGYNAGVVSAKKLDSRGSLLGCISVDSANMDNVYYLSGQASNYGTEFDEHYFTDGTVAMFLQLYNENGVDGSIWGQNVTAGEALPNFSNEIVGGPSVGTVTLHYPAGETKVEKYIAGVAMTLPSGKFAGGDYIADWNDKADFSGKAYTEIPSTAEGNFELYAEILQKDGNGCFEISNVQKLYAFASVVNEGENTACGVLTKNIVVNENVLASVEEKSNVGFNMDGLNFSQWTPIGKQERPFLGKFNGKGYSINGLYINESNLSEAGLFGYVGGESHNVVIDSVKLLDSYISANSFVGGLVGHAVASLSITASVVEGVVMGLSRVGSFVGAASGLSIVNSFSKGNVHGEEGSAGGFVGLQAASLNIMNSYYAGAVSIGEGASNIGGVVGFGGGETSFENVYYLENESYKAMGESALEGASAVSVEDMENGTLAVALHKYVSADSSVDGKAWGQNVAAATPDLLPRLFENGGEIVFPVVVELNGGSLKGGDISSYVYGNGSKLPTPVREHYDFKGWFTDKDFADESLIAEIPDTAIGALIVYADWSKHEYAIKAVSKDEAKGSVTGGGKFAYGSEVMLKAIAKSGYVFSDWTDGVVTAERKIVVKGDSTFTANFEAVASSSSKNVIASSSSAKQSSSSSVKAKSSSSSVKAKSSSSSVKAKSSSSSGKKKDAIAPVVQIPQFSVVTSLRSLQVAGAPVGEMFAILDMQGRVTVMGRVESANFSVNVPRAGGYFVRINGVTKSVKLK